MNCPSCGSTHITFDWKGVVTMRVTDDVIRLVEVGGVFGVTPDAFHCAVCGSTVEVTNVGISSSNRATRDAFPDLATGAQQLALSIHTDDGWTVYAHPEGVV